MTTHTLYDGNASRTYRSSRLLITARPTAAGTPQAQWLVQFTRWGSSGKMLGQCAAWMPTLQTWDQFRWHPIGSRQRRQIPPAVLADVEAWLRGRPVGEIQDTTTTTETP